MVASGSTSDSRGAQSPELALVDSQFAARAREALTTTDTLAEIDASLEARRVHAIQARMRELSHRGDAQVSVRTPDPALRVPTLWFAAAVTVCAAVAALLVGVRVEFDGFSASADSTQGTLIETDEAPTDSSPTPRPVPSRASSPPKPKSQSTGSLRPSDPAMRRFAWMPVAGAQQYRVELFRGANRILAVNTMKPHLVLPARWRYLGKARSVTPGEYRWYVWPVVSGRRATTAVVQAKLVIP